jgi:hypothetical protein
MCHRSARYLAGATVLALGLALALVRPALATTFRCLAGDVQCLIAAIVTANVRGQAHTIRLEAGTYTLQRDQSFDDGLPIITSALTITGASAGTTILERASSAPAFRLVDVAPTGSLTLTRLALRGGAPRGVGGAIFTRGRLTLDHVTLESNVTDGGGIFNVGGRVTITASRLVGNGGGHDSGGLQNTEDGTVTITGTTFLHNGADGAGAIRNLGHMEVSESSFVENSANNTGVGGAIFNGGTLTVVNSTFARNSLHPLQGGEEGTAIFNHGTLLLASSTLADQTGQGHFGPHGSAVFSVAGATTLLHNTILARNTSLPGLQDCGGMVLSLGHNLIGDPTGCTIDLHASDRTGDPGLAPFTDTGRPGEGYYPLLPTSQAVDTGDDAACPRRDQLGQRRTGRCDIGAISFQGGPRPHDATPSDARANLR